MGRNCLVVLLALCLLAGSTALPAAAAAPAAGVPSVSITSPSDNAYVGSNVTVAWEGSDVDYYRAWLDNVEVYDRELNGTLILEDLADGWHSFRVRAHNLFGTADDSVGFFVDTTNPELVLLSPSQGDALNTSGATVRWNASDASDIAFFLVKLDGLSGVPLNHTATEHTFRDLSNGPHSVTVTAFDGSGNSTARTVHFSVDTTLPTLDIISPSDGYGSVDGHATVAWNASDAGGNIRGYEVFLNGDYQTTVAYTVFTYSFTSLADGEYTVVVRAVDRANNTAQDSASFFVDKSSPSVSELSPGDGASINTDVTVRFSKAMVTGSGFLIVEGVEGTLSWDGLSLVFVPDRRLAYGVTYNVSAGAMDHLGRWANVSWAFTTTDLARVTGTVLDTSGSPLANASVSIVGGPSVLTGPDGTFRLEFHAGEHILAVSHPGFVARNMPLSIDPGEERSLGEVRLSSSDLLPLLGWVAALVGIGLVALLYSMARNRRRRPPVRRTQGKKASRSWQGLEELEKRARRDRDPGDDLDDRGRL